LINVLLSGCSGKMGKSVKLLSENYFSLNIAAGVDKIKDTSDFPIYENIGQCVEAIDVILDFSRPDSLSELLKYAMEKKIPLILCTTGYSEEQILAIDSSSKVAPIFRSANMSLGINLLNRILKMVSPLLYDNYDIEIIEKHHNQKMDAPSGTALLLADTIKNELNGNITYVKGRDGIKKREHSEIGIHAIRGGSIVGDHEVIFAGQGEIIEFKHSATSRDVFATGALKACEYMYRKEPGLYSMDDILKGYFD